jgi:hypothetical protein
MLYDGSPKTSNWDSFRIAHCLELSLAETPKNENLLIAAFHFWSNSANAFLFGHGLMSPTLANVYMIIDLRITGPVYPHKYKGSSRQTGVRTGVGYKRYIQNYMSDGPLSEVEYRAFLNMWLCRFIFCGKANEPTLNHIIMAEDLAAVPLSLSLDFDCNLVIHLSLILALICYRRKSSVLKKSLSISSLTPQLKKKKMPRWNRGPITNCAVASGI